jgi:hypothetical protein
VEKRRALERITAEAKAQDEKVNSILRRQQALKKRQREELFEMEKEVKMELETKLLIDEEVKNGRVHVPGMGGYRMKCGADGCMGYVNEECMCVVCGMETCEECWKVKGGGDGSEDDGMYVRIRLSLTWVGRLANRTANTGVVRMCSEDLSWVKVTSTVGAAHECDDADVKTVELLKATARQCPGCGVPIIRANGCDQMHCIACRHTFSWEAGTAEVGRVHNPEFYQMEREGRRGFMEREVGDVPCGGLPSHHEIASALSGQSKSMVDYWWNVVKVADTISRTSALQYTTSATDRDYKVLHVEVVLGNLSMEKFRRRVRQRVEERVVKEKIRPVLDTLVVCVQDLTNRLMNEGIAAKRVMVRWGGRDVSRRAPINDDMLRHELMVTVHAANEELIKISEYHGRRVPVITTDFTMVNHPIVPLIRYVRV